MASRTASRALRSSLNKSSLSAPAQRRTLVTALNVARPLASQLAKPAAASQAQQWRGMKTIDFAGTKEVVYGQSHADNLFFNLGATWELTSTSTERSDWPTDKLLNYFKDDTLALIGYGSQGHGQGLNLRDNGLNVIIGVRKDGASWKEAQQDGWIPGRNLFDVDEAIERGSIIMNLLSDAAQSETWPAIKPKLTKGKV